MFRAGAMQGPSGQGHEVHLCSAFALFVLTKWLLGYVSGLGPHSRDLCLNIYTCLYTPVYLHIFVCIAVS